MASKIVRAGRGGGTMRIMLDHTAAQLEEWCAEVEVAMTRLNEKRQAARHALVLHGEEGERIIKGHGGQLLATWHPQDLVTLTQDWLQNANPATTRNDKAVHLALWSTAGLEECWGIPDTFWQVIVAGATATASSPPELEGNWGKTQAIQQQLTAQNKDSVPLKTAGLTRGNAASKQWAAILTQERLHPELFWASFLTLPKPEKPAERTQRHIAETCLVALHIAGTTMKRRQALQPEKRPGNEAARRQLKAEQKANHKVHQERREQMEIDIFEKRRQIQAVHSYLQRQKARQAAMAWQQFHNTNGSQQGTGVTSPHKRAREGYVRTTTQSNAVDNPTKKPRLAKGRTQIAREPIEATRTPTCPLHGNPDEYARKISIMCKLEKYKYYPLHRCCCCWSWCCSKSFHNPSQSQTHVTLELLCKKAIC